MTKMHPLEKIAALAPRVRVASDFSTGPFEVYGVAARWDDASAPVWIPDDNDGWFQSGYNVVVFKHDPYMALKCQLQRAIIDSVDSLDDYDLDKLVEDAVYFEENNMKSG